MHSRLLVSGLPRSLPPLPPSPAPLCLPCFEGRQRAAPQSSSFPPTTAPPQTLHMDMWAQPASVDRAASATFCWLLTTTFVTPLRLQLRERFREDLLVVRLRSDRGGEFSSDLLRDFCHGEGILRPFTLPASLQQNGVAECRIGFAMEVARTSMIHAAAPHFLWPFCGPVRWFRVSLPETSPTLRWTGKVGDASVFRVWGSRAFVRDTSTDKLSSCAIPYVFLGFPPDARGWQFYHPTSRRVLPSEDVTFDESVPFYCLFPYRTAPLPPPLLFLALGPPLVDTPSPHGPAPSNSGAARGVASGAAVCGGAASGGAESSSAKPGGAVPEGAESGGAASEGAKSGGAEPEGAESGGTEPEGAEPGGAESEGAESGGAEPRGTASAGGPAGASPRLPCQQEPLSLQELCEWFAQRRRVRSGVASAGGSAAGGTGAGGAGAAGPGGARTSGTGAAGAGGVGGTGAGDPGAGGTGARDPGVGGTGAGGAGAGGTGARGAGASSSGGAGVTTGAGGTRYRQVSTQKA
ncbi:unnamed protein product [Closterium sp. NIES-54]